MPAGENSLYTYTYKYIYVHVRLRPDLTPGYPPSARAAAVCEFAQIYFNPKPFFRIICLYRFKRVTSARVAVRFRELTPCVTYACTPVDRFGLGTHSVCGGSGRSELALHGKKTRGERVHV